MKHKKLTFEECKKGHHKMWTDLAEGKIKEKEYFAFPDIGEDWEKYNYCFMCYWSLMECMWDIAKAAYCDYCPGEWHPINNWKDVTPCHNSLFGMWLEAREEGRWKKVREIAQQIAELPWKEN